MGIGAESKAAATQTSPRPRSGRARRLKHVQQNKRERRAGETASASREGGGTGQGVLARGLSLHAGALGHAGRGRPWGQAPWETIPAPPAPGRGPLSGAEERQKPRSDCGAGGAQGTSRAEMDFQISISKLSGMLQRPNGQNHSAWLQPHRNT